MPNFAETYVCNPKQQYYGFTSSLLDTSDPASAQSFPPRIMSLSTTPANQPSTVSPTTSKRPTSFGSSTHSTTCSTTTSSHPSSWVELANLSQAFITAIAARALIFILADNPSIGLMCFIAVGMAEVSTCEITVKSGDAIKKGDGIGMFHFSGSTHCLVFRPQTKINLDPDYPVGTHVFLNAPIANVAD